MKVAFLVNDLQLSGGVGVVVAARAASLSTLEGWDVTLVLVSASPRAQLARLRAAPAPARARRASRRSASTTTSRSRPGGRRRSRCSSCRADRYAYFVQSLEDRFYRSRRSRAARRGADARPARRVHHRGALDRRHARAQLRPDAPLLSRAQRHRQGGLLPLPGCAEPTRRARCECSSRARRARGSSTSTRRSTPPRRCASRTTSPSSRGDREALGEVRRRRSRRPAQPP